MAVSSGARAIDLPVVEIGAALAANGRARIEAGDQIDRACVEHGFFAVVGHGVEDRLLTDLRRTCRSFFRLSREEKDRSAPGPGDSRGYLGPDRTTLAATLGDRTPPDLSESFSMRGFDDPNRRARAAAGRSETIFRENIWPERPAGMQRAFTTYYAALERLSFGLLRLLSTALGLEPGWFDDKFRDHTTTLIANWYPPLESPPLPGQLRRGAHTDYGAFTILAVDDIPGLQISVDGEWRPVPAVAGSFVVNIGDLMARWTHDRWVSTLHRVVLPVGADVHRERMSVPFFFQPSYDAVIETIPTVTSANRTARYEPVVSGEWISAKSRSMLAE